MTSGPITPGYLDALDEWYAHYDAAYLRLRDKKLDPIAHELALAFTQASFVKPMSSDMAQMYERLGTLLAATAELTEE